jgi:hypothetical protein
MIPVKIYLLLRFVKSLGLNFINSFSIRFF